jgi:hypothetical protein
MINIFYQNIDDPICALVRISNVRDPDLLALAGEFASLEDDVIAGL